jgi:hypothetical protein
VRVLRYITGWLARTWMGPIRRSRVGQTTLVQPPPSLDTPMDRIRVEYSVSGATPPLTASPPRSSGDGVRDVPLGALRTPHNRRSEGAAAVLPGRAGCRMCKLKIEKDEIRVGHEEDNEEAEWTAVKWYHINCYPFRRNGVSSAAQVNAHAPSTPPHCTCNTVRSANTACSVGATLHYMRCRCGLRINLLTLGVSPFFLAHAAGGAAGSVCGAPGRGGQRRGGRRGACGSCATHGSCGGGDSNDPIETPLKSLSNCKAPIEPLLNP